MFYIEPDTMDDDTEYKGMLVMGYAAALLHMKHSMQNKGLEDAALRKL